jgi:hypothetical protein
MCPSGRGFVVGRYVPFWYGLVVCSNVTFRFGLLVGRYVTFWYGVGGRQ